MNENLYSRHERRCIVSYQVASLTPLDSLGDAEDCHEDGVDYETMPYDIGCIADVIYNDIWAFDYIG